MFQEKKVEETLEDSFYGNQYLEESQGLYQAVYQEVYQAVYEVYYEEEFSLIVLARNDSDVAFEVRRVKREMQVSWNLERKLKRSVVYLDFAKKVFCEAGLPTELAFLLVIESGGNPIARSPRGAVGLWQFMPATARQFGLVVNAERDDRLDVVKSTHAAVRYLKVLHNRFGSWELVLAAYNGGQSRLARVIVREGTDNFWELSKRRVLTRETREFVVRFIAVVQSAKDV